MIIDKNQLMRLVNALDLYLCKIDISNYSNLQLCNALDVNLFTIKYLRKNDTINGIYRIIFDHYYKNHPVYENYNHDLARIDSFQDFKKFMKGESIWH